MKRVLSWIVLSIGLFLGLTIDILIVSLCFYLGVSVYNFNNALFWVIIILGGSFGLTIPYLFSVFYSPKLYHFCEWIKPSQKGVRYIVASLLFGVPIIIDCIRTLFSELMWLEKVAQIVGNVFFLIMCLLIFLAGLSNED